MKALFAILARDMGLARQGWGLALGFFALFVTLMPLAVGPNLEVLRQLGPGMIWLGAALATLISLDRLYQADVEDGSVDQLLLSGMPLEVLVLGKVAAHWLTTILPLVIVAPLLGVMLNLEGQALWALAISLAVGTPALSFIGSIAAAMTAGQRRGGPLLSILVLPLFVPTLIFGAASAASSGEGLAFLGAVTLLSAAISPFASAAALRLHVS